MPISSFSHASLILAPLLLLLSHPIVAVGCYSGGLSLDYTGAVDSVIHDACNVLATTYDASGTASSCQNFGNDRINFAVENTADNGASLSFTDCVGQNEQTAMGCRGFGGIRAFGDFQLTFDPNAGSC